MSAPGAAVRKATGAAPGISLAGLTARALLRRTLYRALLRGGRALDVQLGRCAALRQRELDALMRCLPSQVLAWDGVEHRTEEEWLARLHDEAAWVYRPVVGVGGDRGLSAREAVRQRVRLAVLVQGEQGSEHVRTLEEFGVKEGFRALRHLQARVGALARMVYEPQSEAVTDGVRVGVRSEFARFEPVTRRFCYRYTVRIANERPKGNVKLLARRWTISDLDGDTQRVEGLGIVGAFPGLRPGEAYTYSSECPLATPLGAQAGEYVLLADVPDAALGDAPMADPPDVGPPAPLIIARVAPFAHCPPAGSGDWVMPPLDMDVLDCLRGPDDVEGAGRGGEAGGFGGGASRQSLDRTPRGAAGSGQSPAEAVADATARAALGGSGVFASGSKLRGPVAGVSFFPRGRRARRPRQRKR
jgi:ApaG protein